MKIALTTYSDFLAKVTAKSLLPQYIEDDGSYNLFAVEDNISWEAYVVKDGGSDQTDFETNHKASYNQQLEYRSTDGLPKIASALFSDTKSFLAYGVNGSLSLAAGQTGYIKFHFPSILTLSGVDARWNGANLGDYITFEVGFYINENDESTWQQLNLFANSYQVYGTGDRVFDVPSVKDIPSTITSNGTTFNVYLRATCVNKGALLSPNSIIVINIIGWE